MTAPFAWQPLVLRATGVLFLLAFVGAALPESWMKTVYESGEVGPWPHGAIVVYLARALSLLYGTYGLLALYMSLDMRRYLPLIRFLALVGFACAPVMFMVIWTAGLPTIWVLSEPTSILIISALLYLASRPGAIGESRFHP
jgi:hypothetical protein